MKFEITINVNDQFEVELTEHGYQVLLKDFDETFEAIPSLAKKDLRPDVLWTQYLLSHEVPSPNTLRRFRFTLWEIMNIFGSEAYNGNPKQCFVNNSLMKVIEV